MLDRTTTTCSHVEPDDTARRSDYSPDMEYIEVVGPSDFTSIDMPAPCAVCAVPMTSSNASPVKRGVTLLARAATVLGRVVRRSALGATVGHDGVFSGRRWQQQIYPVLRENIHLFDPR